MGGELLCELHKLHPDLQVTGVGGPQMQAQGLRPIYRVSDFNVMGLFEVISQLKRLKRQFNHMVKEVNTWKPDAVVLIDAPDFNMRFAKALTEQNIPVIYYVGPQVWAWRAKRAAQLAKLVDHIMLLFEFEAPFYKGLDCKASVVGHPLVDELTRFKMAHKEDPPRTNQKPRVVLAPGSRKREVSSLLPIMLELIDMRPEYQFALALAPTIEPQSLELGARRDRIVIGQMRPLMASADAAVVASGTATLETGLMGVPMVVGYRLSSASYVLAKRLVKTPHVALVNIVLGERVVPELIQGAFQPEAVARHLDLLVKPTPERSYMADKFAQLNDLLGGEGASRRAAQIVSEYLS
ncbi:MAG: lipid-A-disaccharide synthase [Acidobacteria bacterium]|nr:lipid-A-disaccharide synthase [Acidobacteriota bacterium]